VKMLQVMMLFVATLVMAQANAATDAMTDAQLEKLHDRIKQIAEVCVEGDACSGSGGGAAVEVAAGPRSGADIYASACAGCHAVGVAGAPKNGDVVAWDERLAKGMDKTLANAINGINVMPARGLCMDCTDEELTSAINFMAGRN
jgi:cytochrome c5